QESIAIVNQQLYIYLLTRSGRMLHLKSKVTRLPLFLWNHKYKWGMMIFPARVFDAAHSYPLGEARGAPIHVLLVCVEKSRLRCIIVHRRARFDSQTPAC